jgi:hypothetical protein
MADLGRCFQVHVLIIALSLTPITILNGLLLQTVSRMSGQFAICFMDGQQEITIAFICLG